MSPQRAILKKILVLAFLRDDQIHRFSVYATRAFDFNKTERKPKSRDRGALQQALFPFSIQFSFEIQGFVSD